MVWQSLLSFGMAFFVYGFDLVIDHMGIHLGGGNIAVAQQLLQSIQIRAIFQKMHGEAVAQGVWRDLLFDMGGGLIVLQDLPEALAAHANTGDIDKQGVFLRISQ